MQLPVVTLELSFFFYDDGYTSSLACIYADDEEVVSQ